MDNAKRLTEGDLENLDLARGPAEVNRRRTVLNQVRCAVARKLLVFVCFLCYQNAGGAAYTP